MRKDLKKVDLREVRELLGYLEKERSGRTHSQCQGPEVDEYRDGRVNGAERDGRGGSGDRSVIGDESREVTGKIQVFSRKKKKLSISFL